MLLNLTAMGRASPSGGDMSSSEEARCPSFSRVRHVLLVFSRFLRIFGKMRKMRFWQKSEKN